VTAAGTVCRTGSGDVCDPSESCTGVADQPCPADVVAGAGTVCNAGSGDVCDPAETCSGTAGQACPTDTVAAAGTSCRPAAGACDVAESCTGVADQPCPADAVATTAVTCRPSAGACDVAESCDGVAKTCPTDAFAPTSVVCRPSAGVCDIAETCTGSGPACPADLTSPDGDGDGVCDSIDLCPAVADPLQADGDADGQGDECDPCTQTLPAFGDRAKILITRLNTAPGDERVKIQGRFVPFLTTPTIDPVSNGIRILLQDRSGDVLMDSLVPGGAYDVATKAGWKTHNFPSGMTAGYKNTGKVVPQVDGILSVKFVVKEGEGITKIKVVAKNASLSIAPGEEPVKFTLVVDTPVARGGQCGEILFDAVPPASPSCLFTGGGALLRCM
jgi:hypothetical protein